MNRKTFNKKRPACYPDGACAAPLLNKRSPICYNRAPPVLPEPLHVVDRGGISVNLRSRTDTDPRLIGTKHRVAYEREVTVARGRRDGRTLIIIPQLKGNQVTGLTLLHVTFRPRLAPEVARGVLQGYRGRYAALKDAVTETEATFDDTRLADVDLVDLLTEPVYVLAERWRTR